MQKTLHDHNTSTSIGGRPICNLRFANYIDVMGGSNREFQDFTNRLVDRVRAFGMAVSIEESKIMTISTNNISTELA